MDALSLSSSLSPHLIPRNRCSSLEFPHFLPKFPLPKPHLPSSSLAAPKNSLQFNQPTQNPTNFDPSFNRGFDEFRLSAIKGSPSQTRKTAMMGADTDSRDRLYKRRIVFLGSPITKGLGQYIMDRLTLLDARDCKKDIRLFINSDGGSLSAAMAVYDVMQLLRADVSTIALGYCASPASIILCGGAKGKRLAMPNARIMFCQPRGYAEWGEHDVEVNAQAIMQKKNNVIRIISEHTGRTFEQVEKDLDKDQYMSPIEAVEYGLIDGVIDRDKIIPVPALPEKEKPRFSFVKDRNDPAEFLIPEIPDDEIY